MREATEQWQVEIGDMGLVPEAVMMEEMKRGGQTPETQPPTFRIEGDMVSLACETEGASIVYQTKQGDQWGEWRLYTKSFAKPAGALKIQACRLGYQLSKAVVVR
jgi:hypothetical protein